MLDGEADLIPFNQGKILLGATHENEQAWDLEETVSAFQQLTSGTAPFLKEAEQLLSNPCITASVHVLIHLISLRFGPCQKCPTLWLLADLVHQDSLLAHSLVTN